MNRRLTLGVNRRRRLRRLLLGLSAFGLTACAVGPDYRTPQTAAPEHWHARPATDSQNPPAAADSAIIHPEDAEPHAPEQSSADSTGLAQWWTGLGDPLLNELIDQALAQNRTIRQALASVAEARARRAVTVGGFWPSLGASAGASRSKSEARTSGGSGSDPAQDIVASSDSEVYNLGVDASWELDLFGAKRRALEASTAQLGASEAGLRDALVTLLGDVALNYTAVRTAQSRLEYAQRNLESQHELLEMTRWRAQAGLASALDLQQAVSSYEQQRAQIPSLESNLTQGMNRLAVLTGEAPGAVSDRLVPRRAIPVAPLEIAAGVPADILRRRPDIRRAERQLAAQTAQVGVATAALYPSLSLSGSIMLQSTTASDVLDGWRTERAALSLSMPLFRGGALRQAVKAQGALVDAALANYEATVLAAYEEVENALDAWTNEQHRRGFLLDAVAGARSASELARLEYQAGLVDFQTVITLERQRISLEDSLAVSDGEVTSNLIRLYKALGGGWSVFPQAASLH
ncbi:hypothetical protein ACG33_15050 [Steroidobacter denitrificans]|uniref:RND transporter n=1 Tax=Steroidobacter denitrificans TaxID=465721 RepID=A0A127FEQ8_STEDE|nr:efflux transporter outer membrane subunit [Steroidobacter denitrificans]AMN48391.1 hypothetical protein ACG33_15050 [Steroidobacter denitrificans]